MVVLYATAVWYNTTSHALPNTLLNHHSLMKQRATTENILALSGGLAATLMDFMVLCLTYNVWLYVALNRNPRIARHAIPKADAFAKQFNSESLRQAIRRLRTRGLVNDAGRLTAAGRRYAALLLPVDRAAAGRWNGRWYVVTYDIPERMRSTRDAFRAALKRLGFGKANASTWISPWNLIDAVEAEAKTLNVQRYVLPSITDRLGRESGYDLARRIWNLDALNERYRRYTEQFRRGDVNPLQAVLAFAAIERDDPKLPPTLLPPTWHGNKSTAIAQRARQQLRPRVPR